MKRTFINKRYKNFLDNFLTHLFLIIIISVLIFPFILMVISSLKTYNEVVTWPPKWFPDVIQWKNYIKVWGGDYNIKRGFFNSLVIAASTMIICIILGSLAAYALARFKFTGRRSFLFLMLATQMFSPIIFIVPMYQILKALHLLNTYICLIIPNTAFALPMSVWMLTGYFKSIPDSLEEAAMIDGCSRLKAIFKIIIPITAPAIVSVGIFAFIIAWNDLLFAITFITDQDMRPITMMLTDFKSKFQVNWEFLMGASVIAVIPVTGLFISIQKYLIKGLTGGSVKE